MLRLILQFYNASLTSLFRAKPKTALPNQPLTAPLPLPVFPSNAQPPSQPPNSVSPVLLYNVMSLHLPLYLLCSEPSRLSMHLLLHLCIYLSCHTIQLPQSLPASAVTEPAPDHIFPHLLYRIKSLPASIHYIAEGSPGALKTRLDKYVRPSVQATLASQMPTQGRTLISGFL
jgi:hypothetical protein